MSISVTRTVMLWGSHSLKALQECQPALANDVLNVQSGSASTITKVCVTAYCIAFELDLKALEEDLTDRFGGQNIKVYPEDVKAGQTADIVYARFVDDDTGEICGDVMYFGALESTSHSCCDVQCMSTKCTCTCAMHFVHMLFVRLTLGKQRAHFRGHLPRSAQSQTCSSGSAHEGSQ